MGIFDVGRNIAGLAQSASNLKQQTSGVKNTRKEIFAIRDRLRNTPQFAQFFHNIVKCPERPPVRITADYAHGSFLTMDWDTRTNNYEPFMTVKYQDANVAYCEACAILLLVQECYPNVYDSTNQTLAQIEQGVPVEMYMKKQFVQKTLIPASVPQNYAPQPVQTDVINNQQVNSAPKFCGNCGSPLQPNSAFCTSCGSKIG